MCTSGDCSLPLLHGLPRSLCPEQWMREEGMFNILCYARIDHLPVMFVNVMFDPKVWKMLMSILSITIVSLATWIACNPDLSRSYLLCMAPCSRPLCKCADFGPVEPRNLGDFRINFNDGENLRASLLLSPGLIF